MGLFDKLKKKSEPQEPDRFPIMLGAATTGTFIPMDQIPDPVFSAGVLGPCCGIDPKEGKVYAPIDGKIVQLADTLHAIGIESHGIELMIHIGIDTVDMNGDGFSSAVKVGQTVNKGSLLMTMDLDKIRAVGHPTIVIVIVLNANKFSSVIEIGSGFVETGNDVLQINE